MFARHLTRLARPLAMSASRRPLHATASRLGLLKGMDPILTADLLHVLRSAGHGDEITLVDCNFPAASTATKTVTGTPIVLAGCDLPTAVDAICSIMPLDFFVDCPALCEYLLVALLSAVDLLLLSAVDLLCTFSGPMPHAHFSQPNP
eukprot:COSAG02_NODE_13414_length_1398_cov_0.909931_1_plen_148_part_00